MINRNFVKAFIHFVCSFQVVPYLIITGCSTNPIGVERREASAEKVVENEKKSAPTPTSTGSALGTKIPAAVFSVYEEEEMCGCLRLMFALPEKKPLSKNNQKKTEEFIADFKDLLSTIKHPEIKKVIYDVVRAYNTSEKQEEESKEEEPKYDFKYKGEVNLLISSINEKLKELLDSKDLNCESNGNVAAVRDVLNRKAAANALIEELSKLHKEYKKH